MLPVMPSISVAESYWSDRSSFRAVRLYLKGQSTGVHQPKAKSPRAAFQYATDGLVTTGSCILSFDLSQRRFDRRIAHECFGNSYTGPPRQGMSGRNLINMGRFQQKNRLRGGLHSTKVIDNVAAEIPFDRPMVAAQGTRDFCQQGHFFTSSVMDEVDPIPVAGGVWQGSGRAFNMSGLNASARPLPSPPPLRAAGVTGGWASGMGKIPAGGGAGGSERADRNATPAPRLAKRDRIGLEHATGRIRRSFILSLLRDKRRPATR